MSSEEQAKGVSLDVDIMARAYYEAMDWELSSGLPSPARLERLGLHEVIKVLHPDWSLRSGL